MKTASPHMLSLLNGAAYAALFDGAPTSVSASLLGPITRTYTWFFYGRFRQEIGGPASQVLWSNSAGAADLNTLDVTSGGVVRFGVYGSSWASKSAVTAFGAWHDVVCICDGGAVSMYVDGVEAVATSSPEAAASSSLLVGKGGGAYSGNLFTGELDHFAWYSGFIPTAEQITELRETGRLQQTMPLAFIGFDEGQGSSVSISGALSGFATWSGTPAYVKQQPFGTPASDFYMADLYTFTLFDSTVLRYTSADVDLNVGGLIYSSTGPIFKRGKTRTTVGIEVDTLSISVYSNGEHFLNNTPWIQAVRMGKLDDARIRLDRLISRAWNDTSAGALLMFEGRVASVSAQRYQAELQVVSDLELLNVKIPTAVFQPGCMNTLFDSRCGLSKAAWAVNGTVTSATTSAITTALAQATDYFTLGTIKFNSGPNAGLTRSVRGFSGGVFTFSTPLPAPPQAGDSFTAHPGCNKSRAPGTGDCVVKFNNEPNHRAYPYIPLPETTL